MKIEFHRVAAILFVILMTNPFSAQAIDAARVMTARKEKGAGIKNLFKKKNISYPPGKIFMRIFKQEKNIELWAAVNANEKFTLVKTYKICRSSGTLGPKRKEGDGQMPEGFYTLTHFNPYSRFYLSLRLNYPNASDKILSDKKSPGGDIYIHGNCVTIGCVPINDSQIKELYVIALDARANGQKNIPVHIFPARMNAKGIKTLQKLSVANNTLWNFWRNLKEGYDYFEATHVLPRITVDKNGRYIFL